MQRATQRGAFVGTSEMLLFQIMQGAKVSCMQTIQVDFAACNKHVISGCNAILPWLCSIQLSRPSALFSRRDEFLRHYLESFESLWSHSCVTLHKSAGLTCSATQFLVAANIHHSLRSFCRAWDAKPVATAVVAF